MKTKHTPGPWRSLSWGETISIDSIPADLMGICHINPTGDHNCGIPNAQDRANARLITAAPDLLAAAKEAAELLWKREGNEETENVRKGLNAAIAKAEGS